MALMKFLENPKRVFLFCLIFFGISLLWSGNLVELIQLRQERAQISEQLQTLSSELRSLDADIVQTQRPAFLQRMAIEKLEYVGQNDLVFVFPDEVVASK